MICAAAVGIGYESAEAIYGYFSEASGGITIEQCPLAMSAIAISFAVKEALYWATLKVGEDTNSPVLIANAWHHRSDALTSAVAGVNK